jgi:hypothetical protein
VDVIILPETDVMLKTMMERGERDEEPRRMMDICGDGC